MSEVFISARIAPYERYLTLPMAPEQLQEKSQQLADTVSAINKIEDHINALSDQVRAAKAAKKDEIERLHNDARYLARDVQKKTVSMPVQTAIITDTLLEVTYERNAKTLEIIPQFVVPYEPLEGEQLSATLIELGEDIDRDRAVVLSKEDCTAIFTYANAELIPNRDKLSDSQVRNLRAIQRALVSDQSPSTPAIYQEANSWDIPAAPAVTEDEEAGEDGPEEE